VQARNNSISRPVSSTFRLSYLFGVTDLRVGFGTNRLGSLTKKERDRLLARVWEMGVHHFDTAPLYGGGDSETWLGEFLANGRTTATVTTKCGLQPGVTRRFRSLRNLARLLRRWAGPLANIPAYLNRKVKKAVVPPIPTRSAADYRAIASIMGASLDSSLSKLRRDFVDVFAIHEPDQGILQAEEVLTELTKARDGGKTRAIAAAGHFSELYGIAQSGKWPLDLYQFELDPEGTNITRWLAAGFTPPILFGAVAGGAAPSHMGIDPPRSSPSLKVKAALDANPEGLVLFSTTKIAHAEEILNLAGQGSAA
jgi:hypothetical protein